MPDVTAQKFVTSDPTAYDYRVVGTAIGTTIVQRQATFFKGILLTNRVASGVVAIYDSAGTSGTVIGTIALGTQTFSDPPPLYEFNVATKNGLTVVNSDNQGAVVLYK